jgi:hypothetical protein
MRKSVRKRIGNYALGLFFSSLCLGSYNLFTHGEKKLEHLKFVNKTVSDIGIIEIPASRGKIDALYINLNEENKKFIYSKPSEMYGEFTKKIRKGDKLKIFYENHYEHNFYKIFQLEHNDEVLIDLKDFNSGQNIAKYLGLLGGIFFIVFPFYTDKKNARK